MGACRGSGGTGNGGQGYDVATSVQTQEGKTVDLQNMPLRYGKPDPAVTDAQRQAVEVFEQKRKSAKVEYAYGVDDKGRAWAPEKRGGKSSVRTPAAYWMPDGVFTHNHPRTGKEAGLLGGTFSVGTGHRDGDISTFIANPVRTIRASAAEGTYSMSKGPGFDGRGLLAYARQAESDARKAYKARCDDAFAQYRSGAISGKAYHEACDRAFNALLVSKHNAFIAGQSQYGYTYVLERRS